MLQLQAGACMVSEKKRHGIGGDPTTFLITIGADNQFVDSEILLNIEEITRNVKSLSQSMSPHTFRAQVALGTKPGILQVNARNKEKGKVSLNISHSDCKNRMPFLFSNRREAKNDSTHTLRLKHGWKTKTTRCSVGRAPTRAECVSMQQ